MIKSMNAFSKICMFPLGGVQISAVKAAGSLAAAAASPTGPKTPVSIPPRIQGKPDRKRGRNCVEPIVWMLKPTLVNTATPSTRLLDGEKPLRNGKSRGKCEGERQRGALVHSLHSRSVVTLPEQQWLGNVRWRRIYIGRRTPPAAVYPAVRWKKK